MKKSISRRAICQAIILATILIFALLHAIDNAFLGPHALCPFAGLATLYSLATTGEFVHRIHSSAVFLLLAVLLTAILAGRAFCGWLCPFGTIAEWLHNAGRRLGKKKKIAVPDKLDFWLKHLKYIILIFVLYFTWTLGKLFYRAWCPWHAFMTIFDPAEIIEDVLAGFIILLIIFAISLFVERFFCRYLCPLGAAITLFNRFSLIKPLRKETCSSCLRCEKACPAGIKISKINKINDPECIRCYRCLEECSNKNNLIFNLKWLKPHVTGILVLLVFTGTAVYSAQAGYWERGRVFIKASGEGEALEEGTLEERRVGAAWNEDYSEEHRDGLAREDRISQERRAGAAKEEIPEELDQIKAFTSLSEVSEITGIPLEVIYQIWNLSEGCSPETTLSDITEKTGITRIQLIILLHQNGAMP